MSVTHFEIYGDEPAKLANFYRNVFDWQVEQMPGVNYWRIRIGSAESNALHDGLTYPAIQDLNSLNLEKGYPTCLTSCEDKEKPTWIHHTEP